MKLAMHFHPFNSTCIASPKNSPQERRAEVSLVVLAINTRSNITETNLKLPNLRLLLEFKTYREAKNCQKREPRES